MLYDDLLLEYGSSLEDVVEKADRFKETATVCIGIGGAGMEVLSCLKGKIYQGLKPDNPGDPVPRYDGIQLLGIDSDEQAFRMFRGKQRLADSEFFSIQRDQLFTRLGAPIGKKMIKEQPHLAWLDIDHIATTLVPCSLGGIRQVGRFLLFERVAALVHKLEEVCTTAVRSHIRNTLNIYIFAGLSGGTGSGCFLDVCYLLRRIINMAGWDAKIVGYFFMPDAVFSKFADGHSLRQKQYHNENAYAALKELDYLMDLHTVHDYFEQDYGSGIRIKTQEPPVDMCHLISTKNISGVPDGEKFTSAVNAVADSVMTYLVAAVEGCYEELHNTLREDISNAMHGIRSIPRANGANLCYHILDVSSVELPRHQINTYLAADFMRKFYQQTYRPKDSVTNALVTAFMTENRLRVQDVFDDVIRDAPGLVLPEIDAASLACEPCCERGKLTRVWAQAVNDWYSGCRGTRQRNVTNLTRELVDFGYDTNSDQTLAGRLFRGLYKLSTNPEKGPYYAAAMLSNNGQDLYAALNGEIEKAENQARAQQIQIPGAEDWVIQCNQNLIDARKGGPQKKAYAAFVAAVLDYANYVNAYEQCIKTKEVLETFRRQVKDLYNRYFGPLRELLDNLHETFEANYAYLQSPKAENPDAHTRQLQCLEEMKGRLDVALCEMNDYVSISRFLEMLLENPDAWRKDNRSGIADLIGKFMFALFEGVASRNWRDYLVDKFPRGKHDPNGMTQEIKTHLLERMTSSSEPLLWCQSVYNLNNTFSTGWLFVPYSSHEVYVAAQEHAKNIPAARRYTVRRTGFTDRITMVRRISGVPLYAYSDLEQMKEDYERLSSVGLHLYANTGRGGDVFNKPDWIKKLPDPVPWSKRVNLEHFDPSKFGGMIQKYAEAMDCGVITCIEDVNYRDVSEIKHVLYISNAPMPQEVTVEGLLDGNTFLEDRYNELKTLCKDMLEQMHCPDRNPSCQTIVLRNDGHAALRDPLVVRLDYFMRAPELQRLVCQELSIRRAWEEQSAQLDSIRQLVVDYSKNLRLFVSQMITGALRCTNFEGKADYNDPVGIRFIPADSVPIVLYDRSMKYRKLPLYQAFVVFQDWFKVAIGLPKSKELSDFSEVELYRLYQSMSNKSREFYQRNRCPSDYIVPAILEHIYGGTWIENMTDSGVLDGYTDEERKDIINFYRGLMAIVYTMKNESSTWPAQWNIYQLLEEVNRSALNA